MNVEKYQTIYDKMKKHMIANQSKITDFNEGSVISTIFEAVARVIESIYIDVRNGYINTLRAVPQSVFGFQLKEGTKATLTVKFSRAKSLDVQTVIPIGTRISSNNKTFETTTIGIINAGEISSNDVQAQAMDIGSEYNIKEGEINAIETIISNDVVMVTNTTAGAGGVENENIEDMIVRFKEYINGLQETNYYGFKKTIQQIEGIKSVGIKEHFPPAENIYNVSVYIDDGSGGLSESLYQEIMDRINGNETLGINGCKAPGINVRVAQATVYDLAVTMKCFIYRVDEEYALNEIQNILEKEILKYKIGERVIITDLLLAIKRLSFVKDISDFKINGSTNNIVINENQVAKFKSCDIVFEEYE